MLEFFTGRWINDLVKLGTRKTLEFSDVPCAPDEDLANALLERYKSEFSSLDSIQLDSQPSVEFENDGFNYPGTVKLIYRVFRGKFIVFVWGEVLSCVIVTIQAVVLKELIGFLQNPGNYELWQGYLYASLIGLFSVLLPFCRHFYWFGSGRMAMGIRMLLNTLIFKKMMRLSYPEMINQTTVGQIMNLVSNDSYKFESGIHFHPFLVIAPLQASAVFALLVYFLGWAPAVGGILALSSTIPMQMLFSKRFAEYRRKTIPHTDERIKFFKEAISGAEIMKLYNWEKPIIERIRNSRNLEVNSYKRSALLQAVNQATFFISVIFVAFVILTIHVLMGNTFSTSTVFFVIALVNSLQTPLMLFVPYSIQNLGECSSAVKRIDNFMRLPESKREMNHQNNENRETRITGGTFTWMDPEDPVLSDISIEFPKESLTLVCGPLGSSKSSLLFALLGELKTLKGNVSTPTKISYAAQTPWIFAGTVKENIVFNQAYDEEKYKRTIKLCELQKDLESLHAGDLTIIGERGVNLSGGQKARVALARALYYDADLYLLDDPLSAVDTIVGRRILQNCLGKEGLLKKSTRILVTHQSHFKDSADYLVCLKNGKVTFQGSPDLCKELDDLSSFAEETHSKEEAVADVISSEEHQIQEKQPKKDQNSIVEVEDQEQGMISKSIYHTFFQKFGFKSIFFALFLLMSAQACLFGVYFWINQWALESDSMQRENRAVKIIVFAGLVLAAGILGFSGTIFYFYSMVRTSNSIHDSALKSTLNAPIRFFEANPVGRILNRFSRDQSVVDESFPMTSFDFVRTAIVSIGAIVLVMIGNPWVLFSLVLFVPIFLILRKRYISTSRELKRMDGVTKSPVFEHFSASLEGLVSIRAFTYQATAFQEFLSKVDINNRVWFSFTVVSRWIGFRMDFSVAIILISTALLAVIARNSINPGVVAVSLTYVIQISGLLQWCVRLSAEVENSMTSFERLFRYCNIEPEELDGDKIVPPNDWPKQGKLEIKDLKVRYREGLPYSIKYLNTSVDHAEKIGVCGRTGSGKSTLFKTCFRLVNPTEGSILIDGVDICKIPLNNLRSMLSIIPQDPVIFSGTLRYNLDPFGEYSDERIENVLDVLELRKLISRLPKGIYTEIAESGGNLSVGESQLICVARALLKPSKILFIDEATSNIDKETDRLIQKVIRSEFSDRTVLVIAHRLDTIIDSDRIFVLDSGEIAEIGNAKQLFQRKDGIFRSMAEQAGISLSLQSI